MQRRSCKQLVGMLYRLQPCTKIEEIGVSYFPMEAQLTATTIAYMWNDACLVPSKGFVHFSDSARFHGDTNFPATFSHQPVACLARRAVPRCASHFSHNVGR
jgi:hypothetical protein